MEKEEGLTLPLYSSGAQQPAEDVQRAARRGLHAARDCVTPQVGTLNMVYKVQSDFLISIWPQNPSNFDISLTLIGPYLFASSTSI